MSLLERWLRDFKHAARSLVRAPGFTEVVATLALAIGANAAALLAVVALVACYMPARSAARVDPLEALRSD